ncbi:MAG: ribonuclease H family protein [Pseudomonadota bacterium]
MLGHWLTPEGIKPWAKKVKAILNMRTPRNIKELRSFLGLVTYYRDMWPRRSHILAPLTDLLGKRTYQWTDSHTAAFNQMKAIISKETLLCYPDHNQPFDIETDASDYQLGAVIKQNNRPVAFYSRKLNQAQRNYTTIEKELLSIVETLKTFQTMLLGARLTVWTDHQNLTHRLTAYSTQRVLRWRLLLEEYGPTFRYKRGPQNIIVDALSRVPTTNTVREGNDPIYHTDQLSVGTHTDQLPVGPISAQDQLPVGTNETQLRVGDTEARLPVGRVNDRLPVGNDQLPVGKATLSGGSSILSSPQLCECLLEYPTFDELQRYPFEFETLQAYQQESSMLQAKLKQHPSRY